MDEIKDKIIPIITVVKKRVFSSERSIFCAKIISILILKIGNNAIEKICKKAKIPISLGV
jgi:hypothetical protein